MFHLFKRAAASVAAAAAGKVRLFIDSADSLPKTRDENGNLVVLGNGITNISLVSTVGLVKTYRITRQDGSTFDYTVTDGVDGRSIVSIDRTAGTGAPGTTDTYTITYSKAPLTSTFTVYNGANGAGVGTAVAPQSVGDANSAGTAGPEYANPNHVHAHGSQTNPAHHAVATTTANGFMSSADKTKINGIEANATADAASAVAPPAIGAAGSAGTDTNTYANANHTHAHGDQAGGTLHALATPNTTGGAGGTGGAAGFMSAASRTNLANLFGTGAVYNIKDFGAVADDVLGAGGTDNTAAIQAAIDAAQAAGGGIVFVPAGNYSIQNGLTVRSTGVHIMGVGSGYTADVGDYRTGLASCISWRGAAGGTMLDVFPQSGAAVFPVFGFRLSGLSLDGRDLQVGPTDTGATPAGIGIRMRACSGAHLHDFFLNGPFTTAALDLGTLPPGTIGGVDSHGVLRSIFERFCIRQLDGVVTPGVGLRLSGSASANVNFCKFDTFQIMYRNNSSRQPAIQLNNSDSNTFIMGACNSNGALNTNWGIEILGSNVSAAEVSRANIFYHCSGGTGGIFLAGTALGRDPLNTAVAGLNFTNPSKDNQFRPLSTENGEPVPVFGTGATGGYGITGGSTGPRFMGEGSTLASRTTTLLVNTTTLTQVVGFTAPANFLRAGSVIECAMAGVVSNAAAASNHTVAIRIGGVVVAQSVIALGATARTNALGFVNAKALVLTAGATGTATGPVTYYVTGGAAIVPTATTAAATINTTIANVIELVITASVATSTFNVLSAELRLANQ